MEERSEGEMEGWKVGKHRGIERHGGMERHRLKGGERDLEE